MHAFVGTAGAEGRPLVPIRLGTGLECSRLLKEAYSNLEGADKRYLDKSLKEKHYVEKIHLLLHKEKNASKAKGQEEKLQAAKKASVEAELEYQTAVSEARRTTAGAVHARCRPAWPPSVCQHHVPQQRADRCIAQLSPASAHPCNTQSARTIRRTRLRRAIALV